MVRYAVLSPHGAYFVDTFVSHPWMALVSDTGDPCAIGHDRQNCVLFPVHQFDDDDRVNLAKIMVKGGKIVVE